MIYYPLHIIMLGVHVSSGYELCEAKMQSSLMYGGEILRVCKLGGRIAVKELINANNKGR